MLFWKKCLLISMMLPECVLGISLSWEMTLIVSIAFGSLLFIIIIALVIGCIYVWYNKKQDMDVMEENSASRRNRLRRLNSIHPSREISMAEFEYLHNKSRAEYASMQQGNTLPGYLDSHEPILNPEIRANVNTSPPPPYDLNQDDPDSIASAPNETDLPPLPVTHISRAPNTNTPQNSSPSSSTRNISRNNRSDPTTGVKVCDDVKSKTKSKQNQKAARIINVENPDRLRLKKLSLANKLKKEIETGKSSRRQSADEVDSGRESNETERNSPQHYQDNDDEELTHFHTRTDNRSPTQEITHSEDIENHGTGKPRGKSISEMPLRETEKRNSSVEQQTQSSRTSDLPQRDVRNDQHKSNEETLRPNDGSPRIQQPTLRNKYVSHSGNTNARMIRSETYQDDHGEDSTYADRNQGHLENSQLDDNRQ